MKILQLTSQNIPINYYRHWQYAKHLNDLGHTILTKPDNSLHPFGYKTTFKNTAVGDYTINDKLLDTIVPGCDALWSTITYEPHRLVRLLAARDAYKIPFIIDTDDLVSDVPTYNVSQEKLSAKSDYIKMAIAGFRHADALTTTCRFLADRLKKYNENVFITENCIEPALWQTPRKQKPDNEVRILWAGSTARYGDIQMIRRPIESIIARYKDSKWRLKFIFIAGVPDWAVRYVDSEDIYVMQWADMVDYCAVMRHIAPDIGLSPLVPSDFNRSKSPLKYFDYAMMGAAGIYSDECTYDCVKDGITGFKVKSANEIGWESSMIHLIEDSSLRRRIAETSYDDVMSNHNILKNAPSIASTLQQAIHVGSSNISSSSFRAYAS